MEWKEATFQFKEIADLAKNELAKAGIRVREVFHTGEGRWFVSWFPASETQLQQGLNIICSHIG